MTVVDIDSIFIVAWIAFWIVVGHISTARGDAERRQRMVQQVRAECDAETRARVFGNTEEVK